MLKYLIMKRQFSRAILSGNFTMLSSLNKGDVWALWFRKYIISKDFFCKTNSQNKLNLDFVPKQVKNNRNGFQILHDILIKCLNLDKMPFGLFNLIAISEICCFHLRFPSMFIPRYFTEFVRQNLFLLGFSFNGTSVSFHNDLNKTTSILLTFRQILFAFSQINISSAKLWTKKYLIAQLRSLIWIKNNNGSRIEP